MVGNSAFLTPRAPMITGVRGGLFLACLPGIKIFSQKHRDHISILYIRISVSH